jgi:hypothetical protein
MYSCIWFKATLSESFVIQEYDIHVGLYNAGQAKFKTLPPFPF